MRFITLFLLVLPFFIKAQNCSSPGSTAQTATVICSSNTFFQSNISSCFGPTIPFAGCAGWSFNADNAAWYSFHCYATGALGFLLTPLGPADDYDWAVYDVTGISFAQLFSGGHEISVNLSGNTGPTGCTSTGTGNVNCAGGNPQFNAMPTILAGHDYLIVVSNWSNSGLGYNLDFTGGSSVLTSNPNPPTVTSVGINGCDASKVKITFSEDILCSSITAAGSEFTISNGSHVITGIISNCSSTNAVTEIILNLQTALTAGNYTLTVNNGTDANTLLDVCQQAMIAAVPIAFTIPAQSPVNITGITYHGCAPTQLKIALSKKVLCNSITATGSEFSINAPGNSILSAQTICTGSPLITDTILLTLQQPLPWGNYTVSLANGTDGNSFVDTCGTALTLPFSIPLVINQTTVAPLVQNVNFNECYPNKVTVQFDKPVLCSSISGISEFSITPGTWLINTINLNCNSTGYATEAEILLNSNLPAGNFNVTLINGTDGNTFSDSCYSFIANGYSFAFTTTQAPLPIFDSVQFLKCTPSKIKIFYSNPIKCSSISANGSDFSIAGPAAVSIASATTNTTCTQGYTHWVELHLNGPISLGGNYILHNLTGNDGNGIIDTCNAIQSNTNSISFSTLSQPDAHFTGNILWGCVEDTIVVAHAGGAAVNSWQWSFNGGSAISGQNVSQYFPVATNNVNVSLTVSNGFCNSTQSQNFILNNAFNAAFSINPDTTCVNKPVSFSNNSTGSGLQYIWLMGDGTQFNGQVPAPYLYNSSNTFFIQLIATDIHGCSDSAALDSVHITALPLVSYTGLLNNYCSNERVKLFTNLNGYISNFVWNSGHGATVANTDSVLFNYTGQGQYLISLTATDRFCGSYTYKDSTQVYTVPIPYLGADQILCPGYTTILNANENPLYQFTWSTGAQSPTIISNPVSEIYTVTVNNNGCTGTDDVLIKVLDNCLIKVPSAFTPNEDGLNETLKPTNAMLATEFTFQIFNRYGALVFMTHNPVEGWNGKFKTIPSPTGAYVWLLNYRDPISRQKVFAKGSSLLLR